MTMSEGVLHCVRHCRSSAVTGIAYDPLLPPSTLNQHWQHFGLGLAYPCRTGVFIHGCSSSSSSHVWTTLEDRRCSNVLEYAHCCGWCSNFFSRWSLVAKLLYPPSCVVLAPLSCNAALLPLAADLDHLCCCFKFSPCSLLPLLLQFSLPTARL
jgi:hypothetical protein